MENKEIKFKVVINPFTQKAIVSTTINDVLHIKIIHYKEIDEWNAFTIDNMVFDIHFHYDVKFEVSIYPVINGTADVLNWYEVELILKTSEMELKNNISSEEMVKLLNEKVAKLRDKMELYDLFQQDDEVGLVIKEVEDLIKFDYNYGEIYK